MKLLRALAKRTGGRHDIPVPLTEVAPTIEIKAFGGGNKFVEASNPVFEGGGESAYDFNTLLDEGLIKQARIGGHLDTNGQLIDWESGVKVTPKGFEVLEENAKSWLRKAIDKQPITFLQIILTLITALASFFLGLIVGQRGS